MVSTVLYKPKICTYNSTAVLCTYVCMYVCTFVSVFPRHSILFMFLCVCMYVCMLRTCTSTPFRDLLLRFDDLLILFGLVCMLLCAPHFQSLRATEHLRSSGQRMRAQQFVESSTHQGPWVPPPGKSTRSTMTWKVRTYICTYVCIRSLCSYSVWAGGYVHTHEHTYVHTCVGCVVSAESLPSPGDQPGRGGWRHSADCGRPGQQWVRKCQDYGSEWMCNDQLTYVHLCILTLFVRVCHAVKALY